MSQCPETGITIPPFWIALFSNSRGQLSSDSALWALSDSSPHPHDTGPAKLSRQQRTCWPCLLQKWRQKEKGRAFFFFKTIVTNKANSQIRVAVIQVVHVLMNKLLREGVILFSVPQNLGQYFFYTQ